MINTKGKLTALFIGIRWDQNCEKHFRGLEGINSRTPIGFSIFTNEATNRGTFVLFKDTLVGT